jgi:hypothetical protein
MPRAAAHNCGSPLVRVSGAVTFHLLSVHPATPIPLSAIAEVGAATIMRRGRVQSHAPSLPTATIKHFAVTYLPLNLRRLQSKASLINMKTL